MKRGVLFLVMVACASTPAPPPKSDPAPVPLPPPSADQILRDTEKTYSGAKSYVDQGEQVTTFNGADAERRTFHTAFVRPSQFRFEYREDGSAARAYVIWSDGKETRSVWFAKRGVESTQDLDRALGAATGVSGGTAHDVPSLLGLAQGFKPTDLEAPAYAGTEAIAGHECWKVTGKGRIGATTLWIDTTSHLVRRMVEKDRLTPPKGGPVDLVATTSYEPAIDGAVDVALLAPPDGKPLPQRPDELPAWVGITFDTHSNTPRIQTVVTGGPAERAGIKVGDVVTSVDGEQLGDASKIISKLRAHKSGTKVHLVLARDGKDIPLDVTMEPRPDFAAIQRTLVGSPAPDFNLPVVSGPPIERKGHVVIVDFWATWCGPCIYAMPRLVALGHKYKDLRIVGISSEDEKDIKQFVAENKIDYTIARDAGDAIAGRYFVTGLPTLAIVDKAGVVRYMHTGAGDFGEIEAQVQQYLK